MQPDDASGTAPRDPFTPAPPDPRVRHPRIARVAATIARVRVLNHDMREVVVRLDDDAVRLYPRAGQFMVMTVPGLAGPRSFSLARAPAAERAGEHSFLIRLVPGGAFSQWFAAADRSGAALQLTGPLGQFVRDPGTAPMICIAGGSGLSAVRALLEEAALAQVARDAWLFYGARRQVDLCLDAEIAALVNAWHPAHRLHYVPVLSDEPADSAWRGARGLVTDHLARTMAHNAPFANAHAHAYLCGPPPMVAAGERLMSDAGLPAAQIHRDVFEDVRSPAPVIDNRRCVLCDECLLVKPMPDCIVETAVFGADVDAPAARTRAVTPGQTSGLYYNSLVIDAAVCIRCYACVAACPHGAISPAFDTAPITLRTRARD